MRGAMWMCSLMAMSGVMAVGVANAQQPTRPGKFTNLQVFPPDTAPDVLMNAMKNFTRDLGVRCQFCHAGEEGTPFDKIDFAADSKAPKTTARLMMRMAAELNAKLTSVVPEAPAKGFQVTCWTCHRGAQHPQHAPQ